MRIFSVSQESPLFLPIGLFFTERVHNTVDRRAVQADVLCLHFAAEKNLGNALERRLARPFAFELARHVRRLAHQLAPRTRLHFCTLCPRSAY